jgi:hypothetical protein
VVPEGILAAVVTAVGLRAREVAVEAVERVRLGREAAEAAAE